MKRFCLICSILQCHLFLVAQRLALDSLQTINGRLYYKDMAYSGMYFKQHRTCKALFVFETSHVTNGIRDGRTVFKNSKDSVLGGGTYVQGLKDGPWIEVEAQYMECSEPSYTFSRGLYVQGVKKDKWIEGISEGYYKNGLKEGVWKDFSVSSRHNKKVKVLEGTYIKGKKEGTWTGCDWYDQELRTKMNYKDGLLQGEYTAFSGKKEVLEKGYYEKGKRSGTWHEYSGILLDFTGDYENGVKEGVWLQLSKKDGKSVLNMQANYENGKIKHRIYYHTATNGSNTNRYEYFDKQERFDSTCTIRNNLIVEAEKTVYDDMYKRFKRKVTHYAYKNGTCYSRSVAEYDYDEKLVTKTRILNDTLASSSRYKYTQSGYTPVSDGMERTVHLANGKPDSTLCLNKNMMLEKSIRYQYESSGQVNKVVTIYREGSFFTQKGIPLSKQFYKNDKLFKQIDYTYSNTGDLKERITVFK